MSISTKSAERSKQKPSQHFTTFARESATIAMERKGEFYPSRQNLVFSKSPFERISTVSKAELIENKENMLRIEPPTHKNTIKPLNHETIQKPDLSRLQIFPPSERKEFIQPSCEENLIKTESKADAMPQVNKQEIAKEEWLKKDFIKLENWFLIADRSIIGYRPEIGEVTG